MLSFFDTGLQNPLVKVLLPDGVHLNATGQYLLYRSYQEAILTAKDMVGVFYIDAALRHFPLWKGILNLI